MEPEAALSARDCRRRVNRGVLFYSGPSMTPTLRENDLLELEPCGGAAVVPGDIIAFERQDQDLVVVHRVIARGAAGLITRGDGNSGRDGAAVGENQILGRVSAAWRGSRRFPVRGGRAGAILARSLWLRRFVRKRVALLLRLMPFPVAGPASRAGLTVPRSSR